MKPCRAPNVRVRMDASLAFVGSGAVMGIAVGSSILVTRRDGLGEQRLLALLLVGLSAAMMAITLGHASFGLSGGVLLEMVEYVAALACGPLFAAYVRSRLRGPLQLRPSLLVHLLPAAAMAAQILIAGGALVPFRMVMLVQFAYTAVAVRETIVARRNGVEPDRLRWPARLVAFVVLVHLAQIVRTSFFDVEPLRNVVPITAVVGLQVLAVLGIREAALGRALPSRARTRTAEAGGLVEVLDEVMRRERVWTDPDLSLDRLARAAGSTPHRVSSALNAERGGFFEYVSAWRLSAVRAALDDPANDIFTIDALAENAGFRSRSTFYAAFRKKFGVTPSGVRKRS